MFSENYLLFAGVHAMCVQRVPANVAHTPCIVRGPREMMGEYRVASHGNISMLCAGRVQDLLPLPAGRVQDLLPCRTSYHPTITRRTRAGPLTITRKTRSALQGLGQNNCLLK